MNVNDTWQKAAIENAATSDVVQLNTLINEETGLQVESIEQETTNSSYQSGLKWTVTLACPDFEGFDSLRQWYLDGVNIYVYAAAADSSGRNLRMQQDGLQIANIVRNGKGKRSDGDSYWKLTVVYYGDADSYIFNGVNLLYEGYGWKGDQSYLFRGFHDKDGDGIADGYRKGAKGTYSFANGKQTGVLTTALPKPGQGETYNNRCRIFKILYFPISGIDLTFSADYTVRQSTQGQPGQLRVDMGYSNHNAEIGHVRKNILENTDHLFLTMTTQPGLLYVYFNLFITHLPCDLDVWNPA